MAAAQRAGACRRAGRAGGACAIAADRSDLDGGAFAYVPADRASPVRTWRQSALGTEVPHDVAAGIAAHGTFRAGGIHRGREHFEPLRAFLPAAFDRRIAAASERSAGRNVAGGAAADHGLRVEAALSPPRGRSAGGEARPLRPVADYGAEWADLRAAPRPRSGVGAQPFA